MKNDSKTIISLAEWPDAKTIETWGHPIIIIKALELATITDFLIGSHKNFVNYIKLETYKRTSNAIPIIFNDKPVRRPQTHQNRLRLLHLLGGEFTPLSLPEEFLTQLAKRETILEADRYLSPLSGDDFEQIFSHRYSRNQQIERIDGFLLMLQNGKSARTQQRLQELQATGGLQRLFFYQLTKFNTNYLEELFNNSKSANRLKSQLKRFGFSQDVISLNNNNSYAPWVWLLKWSSFIHTSKKNILAEILSLLIMLSHDIFPPPAKQLCYAILAKFYEHIRSLHFSGNWSWEHTKPYLKICGVNTDKIEHDRKYQSSSSGKWRIPTIVLAEHFTNLMVQNSQQLLDPSLPAEVLRDWASTRETSLREKLDAHKKQLAKTATGATISSSTTATAETKTTEATSGSTTTTPSSASPKPAPPTELLPDILHCLYAHLCSARAAGSDWEINQDYFSQDWLSKFSIDFEEAEKLPNKSSFQGQICLHMIPQLIEGFCRADHILEEHAKNVQAQLDQQKTELLIEQTKILSRHRQYLAEIMSKDLSQLLTTMAAQETQLTEAAKKISEEKEEPQETKETKELSSLDDSPEKTKTANEKCQQAWIKQQTDQINQKLMRHALQWPIISLKQEEDRLLAKLPTDLQQHYKKSAVSTISILSSQPVPTEQVPAEDSKPLAEAALQCSIQDQPPRVQAILVLRNAQKRIAVANEQFLSDNLATKKYTEQVNQAFEQVEILGGKNNSRLKCLGKVLGNIFIIATAGLGYFLLRDSIQKANGIRYSGLWGGFYSLKPKRLATVSTLKQQNQNQQTQLEQYKMMKL